ncbi:lipase family protein [Kordia sp.]|uniref:lipase family protein n=1 Tax=Kordia sp. TaxID=1965332 RepID=UPI003D6BB8B6
MNPSNQLLKQIYSLSFSVNSASGLSWSQNDCKSGMIEMQSYVTKVAKDVLKETKGIIGDWKAIWGPIVYANDPTSTSVHADNTMGMYYNEEENTIVIGIAGTNINSPYGWFVEDFSVQKTVSWELVTGAPNSGNISNGTHIGLNILLNMTNKEDSSMLTALKNFLHDNSHLQDVQVAVAGHSLGGALSPTLALYLVDKKNDWDPENKTSVGAFPTAGPTPGDEGFASYYEKQIAANKIYYLSQHNALDVVPHAWEKGDLEKIPTIYEEYIKQPSDANPAETLTGTLATVAALNALSAKNIAGIPVNRYKQISPSTTLQGSFNTTIDDKISKKLKYIRLVLPLALGKYAAYLRNLVRFAAQAGTQHVTAYYSLLDVETFMDAYKEILNNNKPSGLVIHEPYEQAVKSIAKIDLKKIDAAAMKLAEDNH